MRSTSAIAESFSSPVGCPRRSRTIAPFFGARVWRVIPAASSARVFTHSARPSCDNRRAGRSLTMASSCARVGWSAKASYDQPPPTIQAASGRASVHATMRAWISSMLAAPNNCTPPRASPPSINAACASSNPGITAAPFASITVVCFRR